MKSAFIAVVESRVLQPKASLGGGSLGSLSNRNPGDRRLPDISMGVILGRR